MQRNNFRTAHYEFASPKPCKTPRPKFLASPPVALTITQKRTQKVTGLLQVQGDCIPTRSRSSCCVSDEVGYPTADCHSGYHTAPPKHGTLATYLQPAQCWYPNSTHRHWSTAMCNAHSATHWSTGVNTNQAKLSQHRKHSQGLNPPGLNREKKTPTFLPPNSSISPNSQPPRKQIPKQKPWEPLQPLKRSS